MRAVRRWLGIASMLALCGCELVADFDREKIPRPHPDAEVPDNEPPPADAATGDHDAGDDDAGDDDAGDAGEHD